MKFKRAWIAIALMAPIAGFGVAQAQDVVPAQNFHFKADAFGCLSKDKFDAALQHQRAGEQGQAQQFFTGYDCVSTPPETEFRAIRVIGHDVEFVGASNTDTQGLWTTDQFIRQ